MANRKYHRMKVQYSRVGQSDPDDNDDDTCGIPMNNPADEV